MNEIVWRVKKGWVYLVGIALMVGFSALAYGEVDIKAAKENKGAPKQVSQESGALVAGNVKGAPASSAPTTTKPEEKKTKTKTIYKTVTVDQSKTVTSSTNTAPVIATTKPPVKKDSVKLVISGLGTYDVEIKKGDSAFDVTKRAASQNGFVLEYKQYSWGVMITRLGGLEAEWPTWWAFYFNGESAKEGASIYGTDKSEYVKELKNNDSIEWRFSS